MIDSIRMLWAVVVANLANTCPAVAGRPREFPEQPARSRKG